VAKAAAPQGVGQYVTRTRSAAAVLVTIETALSAGGRHAWVERASGRARL